MLFAVIQLQLLAFGEGAGVAHYLSVIWMVLKEFEVYLNNALLYIVFCVGKRKSNFFNCVLVNQNS